MPGAHGRSRGARSFQEGAPSRPPACARSDEAFDRTTERHAATIALQRHSNAHVSDGSKAPFHGLVRQHGAWANVPTEEKSDRGTVLQSVSYRARNLVERFFNKIKHCRHVATRYDKFAANYLAFIQLASIRLWLRVK
jgi:transposase